MFDPNNFELIAFDWGHGRAGCRRPKIQVQCATLTLFQKREDDLTSKTLTELDAEPGPLEWTLNSADMVGTFNIVLDVNGEEFLHYAFLARVRAGTESARVDGGAENQLPPGLAHHRSLMS